MAEPTSYDAVPFPTRSLLESYPDGLATLATLMGLSPAPVDRCRVLELGCGTGGNLTPMAATLPGSRFVGLDLSAVQIAEADRTVRALGLTNVEYRAGSILDLDDDLGPFDYILCHGVYSWVPPAVQDKILAVCGRHLAPHGVAYVSYNTYPGWHLRSVAREAMAFLARGADTPEDQVRAGRSYLKFLAANALDPDGPYGRVLKQEAEILDGVQDYYVYHEHLESDNRPVYFTEFVGRAAGQGLQYLGESVPHRLLSGLPEHVQDALRHISPDLIHLEQHIDFLRGRAFRRTLLCRADVTLDRSPKPDRLARLKVSARARPKADTPNLGPGVSEEYTSEASVLVTDSVPLKAALTALWQARPRAVPVSELVADVGRLLGRDLTLDETTTLSLRLIEYYLGGLVGLHTHAVEVAAVPSDRPVGLPYARTQAATLALVTNARHEEVRLEPGERLVLILSDGTRNRSELVTAVTDAVNRALLPAPDGPVDALVPAALDRLARSALLSA